MLASKTLAKQYFFMFQIIVAIIGTFISLIWGVYGAFSFLLGSLLMFVANLIFLFRFFFSKKVFSPIKEVLILYASELVKLCLVAVGSIVLVIYTQANVLMFLLGLIALQVTMWCMPFFMKADNK